MHISLFDLDRTLLRVNSGFAFSLYLYRKGVLSLTALAIACLYYMRHLYCGLPLEKLHEKAFSLLLQGMSMPLLLRYAQDFVDFHFANLIYFPAWERLKRAQHEGHFTCILSNAPSFLVRCIAKRLHVDSWESSEYLVDKDDRLCQIQRIVQGEEKADYVRHLIQVKGVDKTMIIGYSDSYLDLPFLYSVGRAVVVNPDRKLQRVARKLTWEQI